jgi:hypothetical protein
MSSRDPRRPEPAGVSRVLAVVFAGTGFFALIVFGLGAVSIVTDAEIISVPGLGPFPGVVGVVAALLAFACALVLALRADRPSFVSVPMIALTAGLAHLVAVWASVLASTGDVILSTVVAGDLVRGGSSVVIVLAASIAAWGGIALRRTRARHPRWPWERDEDE